MLSIDKILFREKKDDLYVYMMKMMLISKNYFTTKL